MLRRYLLLIGCMLAMGSSQSHAVYFPAGIDWANPSQNRFVLSLYLNMLGRAPDNTETLNSSRFLSRSDTSQRRLDLFKNLLGTSEYQQIFPTQDNQWRVYRAPDHNYGAGYWRYQAAQTQPAGFQSWYLSGSSSESIAEAMAHHYSTYCFRGTPCIAEPADAYKRGLRSPSIDTLTAHACADESNLKSQFQWVGTNGTTYPRGVDDSTLCMGQHYFKANGLVLQRYQCAPGYIDCQRDQTGDIRGRRTGTDSNGNPTTIFADGSRLTLTSSSKAALNNSNRTDDSNFTAQPDWREHNCANPDMTTSLFRWQGPSGATDSIGIGTTTICMNDGYYEIEGINLKRFDCTAGYRNCQAAPAKNVAAEKRKRIDGHPGLEFRNGTTLALVKRGTNNTAARSRNQTASPTVTIESTTPIQSPSRRRAGQHECADTTLRVSQFRWSKQNGDTSWPDGVDGRFVCLQNSYYEIDNSTLRHHQCSTNFTNCRANRRNDLIAIRESSDNNGYRTLFFANGDQLSLISR